MIHIKIDKGYAAGISRKTIRKSALNVLSYHGKGKEIDLSIIITGDQEIKELNRQYRSTDKSTDVLSFPLHENDPETGLYYLGDIIISYQTAESQANHKKHSIMNEIQLLVVHGMLHLLEYDHHTPLEKDKMWSVQSKILAILGLDALILSE
jgi:probable rRNA maturation factor